MDACLSVQENVWGESRWDMIPACDGEFGSILRIYREWKYTGDDEFLKGIWDNMMKALEFSIKEWDTDGDGVLMENACHI